MTAVLLTSLSATSIAAGVALWGSRPELRLSDPRSLDVAQRWRAGTAWGGRWFRLALPLPAVVLLAVVGPIAVVPSLVFLVTCWLWRRRRSAARRLRQEHLQDRDDVQALRALAAELRSGLPPTEALRTAGSGGSPLGLRQRMLTAAVADKLGGDPAQALGAGATPGSAAGAIAAAWAVCQVTGAGLAAPVSRIADAAAAGLLLTREADAALASARSSARLLAVLPVAGVAIGALSGTGSIRVLVTTPPGQACLLLGAVLELAGLSWLDKLAQAAG